MKAVCPYCGAELPSKSELELHIAHTHPQMMKERGVESYFQVLLSRERNGYYTRQIAYSRRKR